MTDCELQEFNPSKFSRFNYILEVSCVYYVKYRKLKYLS